MERPFSAYKGSDPYIFVSYAHDDAELVYPELQRLRDAGFNVWYDEGISPGSTWRDEVALALTQCSLFLLFVTPRSVASHNCQQELNFSLSRERKMLCAHLEDTSLPPGMELSLSDKQAIIRQHYTGDVFTQKLVDSLREVMPTSLEPIPILKQEPVAPVDPNEKSIAVLPLENRSSDPENEYLSDGISEEIIAGLAKVDGLRVASEIASFAMKGQNADLATMGARLGVDTILSGSVRKQGDRVRINVLLNQVSDGSTLWSERYDREMEDIFELQDDVVRQVIDALKVELGTGRPEVYVKAGTSSVGAYNEYLLGVFETNKHHVRSYHKAASHLRRAIELDPDYFAPCPRLIFANFWLTSLEGDPDGERLAESLTMLVKMAELDPEKANNWSAEGWVNVMQGVDLDAQEDKARDTIVNRARYHPNYVANAHLGYANLCRLRALYHAQLEFADRALTLGAPDSLFQRSEGWAALGYFDRAIECCVEDLRVNPENAVTRSDYCSWLARTGQYEKARQELDVLSEVWGPRHLAVFNYHYWKGEMDEAIACFEWLKDRKRYDMYYKGLHCVMLGDVEAGLDWFWQAHETSSGVSAITRVLNDGYLSASQLEDLYCRERYQELLRKLSTHDDDQVRMLERMNSIKNITGVEVKRDSEYL